MVSSENHIGRPEYAWSKRIAPNRSDVHENTGATSASYEPRTAAFERPTPDAWKGVQDRFWDVMTAELNVAPDAAHAAALVDPRLPTPAARGLNAYVDAYFFRIAESIEATYPALANVLGQQPFYQLLKGFLAAHPSTSFDLKYAGRTLPEYLLTCAMPTSYGVPRACLRDLAALEWARGDVVDERDGPSPVGVGTLHELAPDDWEVVRFGFAAAVRLVRCAFAVEPVIAEVSGGKRRELTC